MTVHEIENLNVHRYKNGSFLPLFGLKFLSCYEISTNVMKEKENTTEKVIDYTINERIKKLIEDKLGVTVYEFSKKLGNKRADGIYKIIKNEVSPGPKTLQKIYDAFPEHEYWLKNGETEEDLRIRLGGRSLEENFTVRESDTGYQRNELIEKTYNGSTPVRVVTTKARAGWSDAYYSEEYLADMPLITIETDENYKGEYLAFEVDGDSMEPEYFPGDIVICRMVKRDLWQYKLHYDQYDFVIAHSIHGIMLKEIVNHDTETGMITCHSLNPDHADFTINLREVAYLYNVVEVRQSGKSKKRRR